MILSNFLRHFLSVACFFSLKWFSVVLLTEAKVRSGVDVVIGTPGRITDFLERRTLDLSQLKHVVLDEVDRMLDMGFADSVDEILRHRYRRSM